MPSDKPVVVFDCEIYSDYFLAMFRNIGNGKTIAYEAYEGHDFPALKCMQTMLRYTLVSFNGRRFDVPLLMMACEGDTVQTIKDACNAIIVGKLNYWDDDFKSRFPNAAYHKDKFDHIDLIEVAPGQASLKIYGGRMHSKRMQDLPIHPDDSIEPDMRQRLIEYCGNDLQTTVDLYTALKPQIELREQMSKTFGVDLRSKSDAQIAEQVIRGRVQHAVGNWIERPVVKPGTCFRYNVPPFIAGGSGAFRDAVRVVDETIFQVNNAGNIEMPLSLKDHKVEIGAGVYRMGIGGLHSSEESVAHYSGDDRELSDHDVTSYYPRIILNLGLYPQQLTKHFLVEYDRIIRERVHAKHTGDKVKADSLKIVANGSFGKFGSKYSTLYSPQLLIQTTLTGQLSLLMLIDMLEAHGIPVVSANTDGIVIECPCDRTEVRDRIIWVWEQATGFETEATKYRAIFSRDVNNYIALKEGGGAKLKGAFAAAGLAKNPTNEICNEAVVEFLENGVTIESTIRQCTDIRKFVTIRKVAGGATKDGVFLGKAVRWYYAKGCTGTIIYQTTGYTVARSEGGKPLMDLPDTFPVDVDFDWYIAEAKSILKDVGYVE